MESAATSSSSSKKTRESSVAAPPNSINMASTSASATTPTSQEASFATSSDDVFFGRTTRLMWKAQTEQAAASSHQQSPKWNEPDTDYAPPVKKSKKERSHHHHHRDRGDSGETSFSTSSEKHHVKEEKSAKKHKKSSLPPKEKPPKTPKAHGSSRHSETPTTHRGASTSSSSSHHHHHIPSQPKPTAPPPVHQPKQVQKDVKLEEPMSPDMNHAAATQQLDAKTMDAIRTIREAAKSSARATLIQNAIDSVLSKGTTSPTPPSHNGIVAPPSSQNPQAAIPAAYPPPAASAPPGATGAPTAPAAPPPPAAVVPASVDIVAEQRHTFMIPPTDPLYHIIVSYYFDLKKYFNAAKGAEPELIGQIRQDIEAEKVKKNELMEATSNTNSQINELLSSGVHVLKGHLDELGMHKVSDVTELLAGSKHIVTQHKGLTTNVAQMETSVAVEEHKLKIIGGPDALKYFEEALHSQSMDIMKLSDLVISTRPPNFVAQILPDEPTPTVTTTNASSDSKVSPSGGRRPRQPRPKANGTAGGKRGPSAGGGGRKSDGPTEDVEMEIRQFVQHALKVDNAVKEKERKARGNLISAVAQVEAIHPK
ncbi:hypothetical protein GCK72_003060 [Caenorhabditis remanei]|uniref:Uncharacterized protein n=1 Tax=Caenorhabditis remanei TaxID=31234 RepID=A0A6A5HWN2_CAERE|nr:hypothetical protein GCK72_003060 [Caenorhabditis remanei]KAF1771234.1 hypothetical protein GCK72_003060 [Caenorhabditis remanei]